MSDLIERLADTFKRAAFDRLMHEDGCEEGEQIKAGLVAVLSSIKPGDVLPGGLVAAKNVSKGDAIKACALAIGHPNNHAASADATDCVTTMRMLMELSPLKALPEVGE